MDTPLLRWKEVYREVELYKSALRVYTKPLFGWRKALFTSTDHRTLYDFAARGLGNLDDLHTQLLREKFVFRPSVALHHNFNGKHRTLYIPPWEERIVDLLLYRILTRELQAWLSPNSYAYRERLYGLDRCQTRIARLLRTADPPRFVVKRDIANYFDSINHEILLSMLGTLVRPDDYLFRLLEQRVRFAYRHDARIVQSAVGVPFGSAIACAFANIYLTGMDRRIQSQGNVHYFRYADDLLVLAHNEQSACRAREVIETSMRELCLRTKSSHERDLVLGSRTSAVFEAASQLRHLGLQFRATGEVDLAREKSRKIQNLFRYAFRRSRRRWLREKDPTKRASLLILIAQEVLSRGVRNVAIIDYYLKHVTDDAKLSALDRWLAEEVLACVFGGHKKKHFQRIPFEELRRLGLPSLLHRRRLILRRAVESPFFVWQQHKAQRAFRGAVVRSTA